MDFLAGVLLLSMMVLIIYGVLMRYVLRIASELPIQVTEFMIVAVVYLPLAYVLVSKRHIRIESMVSHIPLRGRAILSVLTLTPSLIFFSLVAWQGWEAAWTSYVQGSKTNYSLALPLFPAQLCIPIGSFFLCLALLKELWEVCYFLIYGTYMKEKT